LNDTDGSPYVNLMVSSRIVFFHEFPGMIFSLNLPLWSVSCK